MDKEVADSMRILRRHGVESSIWIVQHSHGNRLLPFRTKQAVVKYLLNVFTSMRKRVLEKELGKRYLECCDETINNLKKSIIDLSRWNSIMWNFMIDVGQYEFCDLKIFEKGVNNS